MLPAGPRDLTRSQDPKSRCVQPSSAARATNLLIEYRWAEGNYERLRGLADELVQLKVDVFAGGLGIRVATLRGKEDVDLTSNIEIVCSAAKAGINHWSTGHCEWAGAIRHDPHVRNRTRGGRRIIKAEDPHGQIKFGRQLLDRPCTPTGQHRIETTSPGLHGHKMPRIAVGSINHPVCAAGHNRLIVLVWSALAYRNTMA
jgi:hypothetical protein